MAAIQAANDGEWLPDKSKDTNRPWSLKKYRVYTETAVYMGTTEKPIHMDAVVAETMGCVNLTDMMLHVIEIKISENDLKRDHKMQEYARCADYNDSAQKTPTVRKNVRGMNAPITNNATIIPTGFSSGIVGFSWPDVLQNAVIRCIALLFQEKHFR